MSHEVVFLPHILGQTWAQALAAARTAAREEDPTIVAARLEPWPDLVLHAAQILGQIEEYRGRGQRELLHPVTRLRFTFFGEDGVIALPYWYDGPVARMAATMAFRFARAVEADTGLAAYDPQQRTPLAEMGLEKFIAGYLRGREKALGQAQARGPVPVGHALPTGRSVSRRELSAGPSATASRAGEDSGRRAGKPARGEPVQRSGKVVEPRKAPRRGERPDDERAQRAKKVAEPRKAPRGGDSRRSGEPRESKRAPEPRQAQQQRGVSPDSGRAPRSGQPSQSGQVQRRDERPRGEQRRDERPRSDQQRGEQQRGELRRAGDRAEPRQAPRPGESPDGKGPMGRRQPPELPGGRR